MPTKNLLNDDFCDKLHLIATPIGKLGLQFVEDELSAVHFLKERTSFIPQPSPSPFIRSVLRKFEDYFLKGKPLKNIPYRLQGTPFQNMAWQALSEIPFAQTVTYGDIAKDLRTSPRAIGAACRTNLLPILIPCHRVVAYNGLGGFTGKSESMREIKKWLLTHEGTKK